MLDIPLITIVEGRTPIFVPDVEAFRKSPSSYPPSDAPIFYNSRMEINRDFALAILRAFIKKRAGKSQLRYCEPMAGCGIRSVRVANEIDDIEVIINDRNPLAVALIKENVTTLQLEKKAQIHMDDANELLIRNAVAGKKFDVIDLDPFGSPAMFIDSAAQAIGKNGLLAVTSTDMATMCGVYPGACIRKYASQPIHSWIAHEVAVRMLIGFIAIALARHEKGVKPVFAHSTEHFIRVYLVVEKGVTKAKEKLKKLGFLAHCLHCGSIESSKGIVNKLSICCSKCQAKRLLGGPLWLGAIFEKEFVEELELALQAGNEEYGTRKRMLKILSLIKEDVKAETLSEKTICYYDIHQITDKLNLPSPKTSSLIAALKNKGFVTTRTHFRMTAIKTDAPIEMITEAIQEVLGKE